MSGSTGVTCNRCQQSSLGWCISRATRKHYLAWLVPTPTVAADGVTIVQQLKPQPNLLHRCGPEWSKAHDRPQTIEDARQEAAEYAAERAKVRALGQSPQPIAATPAPTATAKPARKAARAKNAAKPAAVSTAALGAVSITDKTGTALPFGTNGAVHVPSADIPGPIEAAVVMVNALVARGFPRPVAVSLAQTGTPAQIAALLLS